MEIVEFSIIPKNSPDLCGRCFTDGDNCSCDCHKEPIFSGYHDYCYSLEIYPPILTKAEAYNSGLICIPAGNIYKVKRFLKRLREIF